MYPITPLGKFFVSIYVCFGLSTMAFCVAICSKKFYELTEPYVQQTEELSENPEINTPEEQSSTPIDNHKNSHQTVQRKKSNFRIWWKKQKRQVFALIMLCFQILIGAAIFNFLEEDEEKNSWGYGNSLYFCFITLTTIGNKIDLSTFS